MRTGSDITHEPRINTNPHITRAIAMQIVARILFFATKVEVTQVSLSSAVCRIYYDYAHIKRPPSPSLHSRCVFGSCVGDTTKIRRLVGLVVLLPMIMNMSMMGDGNTKTGTLTLTLTESYLHNIACGKAGFILSA
jgi:hypothetical protein